MVQFIKELIDIAIGVLGQSNEHGAVVRADSAAYPLAFASQIMPARCCPAGPAIGIKGGWWWYVHDRLMERGYNPMIVNGAIGGASFLTDYNSLTQSWSANKAFYQQRGPISNDAGDFGSVIAVNGGASGYFLCTVGNKRAAWSDGVTVDAAGNQNEVDYISTPPTASSLKSGATAPDWASVTTTGGTIVDGQLTWTKLSGPNYGNTLGGIMDSRVLAHNGNGFDPLNLCHRLHRSMQATDARRKIIYIQNGQSDLGNSTSIYEKALRAIAYFFLDRGYEVMIGLTCWGGNASTSTVANYDNLKAGVATALATLQAEYPGKVWSGADLYTSMGTSGPMGAKTFNAAISGSVMTVTADLPGMWGDSLLEIGMGIYDSSNVYYGTIASFGSGTGGAGTYNLTNPTALTKKAVRAVGAFIQGVDGVHLNGAGAVGPDVAGIGCAGKYVAASFDAVLPDRRPLTI